MIHLSLLCPPFRAGMRCSPEGRCGSCGNAGGSGQPGAGDPRHDSAACKSGGHHPSQEKGKLHSAREGQSAFCNCAAVKREEDVVCKSEYWNMMIDSWMWIDWLRIRALVYLSRRLMSNLSLCLQALERFYEAVMQAILRHINFDGSAAV